MRKFNFYFLFFAIAALMLSPLLGASGSEHVHETANLTEEEILKIAQNDSEISLWLIKQMVSLLL